MEKNPGRSQRKLFQSSATLQQRSCNHPADEGGVGEDRVSISVGFCRWVCAKGEGSIYRIPRSGLVGCRSSKLETLSGGQCRLK
jgi:hypothetical protein